MSLLLVLCGMAAAADGENESLIQRLEKGVALRTEGRYAEAMQLLGALYHEVRSTQANGRMIAAVADTLGVTAHELGSYGEAESLLNAALVAAKDTSFALTIEQHLGELYLEQRREKDAEALFRHVVQAREMDLASSPAMLATARIDLALTLGAEGKRRQAEELLRAGLTVIEAEYGADHPMLLSVLNPLASMMAADGKVREALPYSERAWRIIESSPDVAAPDRVNTTIALSALYSLTGNAAKAKYFLGEGLRLVESIYGPDNPRVGWFLLNYAAVERRLHQKKEAKAAQARGEAILSASKSRPAEYTVHVNALR